MACKRSEALPGRRDRTGDRVAGWTVLGCRRGLRCTSELGERRAPRCSPSCSHPRRPTRPPPFEEPFQGLPAIAAMWEAEREGPEEVFAMDSEVVAVEGDTGVARLE